MKPSWGSWILLWGGLLCCLIFGLSLFSFGFFPSPISLEGLQPRIGASQTKVRRPCLTETNHQVSPRFDRLILFVIDGLRMDFVFGPTSPMKHLQQRIQFGQAHPFIAYAHPPTVTLPRIKVTFRLN